MTTQSYPDLGYLLRAYFHQDWAVAHERPGAVVSYREVIEDFRDSETLQKVANVVADLDRLIAQNLSEPELRELSQRLGSQFYPPGVDTSYREWFQEVRDILTEPPAGARGRQPA